MVKGEVEEHMDHAIRVIGSVMVSSNQRELDAAMMIDGEFYKMRIIIEKVVEDEE